MNTNKVKNPTENYDTYISQFTLLMRRIDNNNKILDGESYKYVQFVHISKYSYLIDKQINSLNEVKATINNGNTSYLFERISKDYNKIDIWLKLVKVQNPILEKYEMNGSTHLYFSKNINHEHSKIVLSYIAMLDSFEVFYKPILEVIPNKIVVPKPTKSEILKPKLLEYNFNELKKVTVLNNESRTDLIKKLAEKGLPYQIAMLDYLGFLEYLHSNYFKTKYKLRAELVKILDATDRSIKGNISVLDDYSKENKKLYTSHLHKEKVIKDYEQLI